MQIKKTSKDSTFEVVSLKEFERDIKDRFIFLKLGKHSIRMDSKIQAVEFLKDGFTIFTIDCHYRKIKRLKTIKKF